MRSAAAPVQRDTQPAPAHQRVPDAVRVWPNLQRFIDYCGCSWSAITPKQWAQWDQRCQEANKAYRVEIEQLRWMK